MSYKIRGGAPRKEIRRPAPERSNTQHKRDRRDNARVSAVAPLRKASGVRPMGFAAYAFTVFAALYLAAHVGAALLGWRIVAICALTLIWLGLTGWSWATARTWGGDRS